MENLDQTIARTGGRGSDRAAHPRLVHVRPIWGRRTYSRSRFQARKASKSIRLVNEARPVAGGDAGDPISADGDQDDGSWLGRSLALPFCRV